MADAEVDKLIAAAPASLYYLAIDGTEAKDSAAFGAMLEKNAGWKNLASFLSPAPDHKDRVTDPAHAYLPIWISEYQGKRVAVVCPGGDEATGTDLFWHQYPGPDPVMRRAWPEYNITTEGRHTAAQESAQFMQTLILKPEIEIVKSASGVEKRFADPANKGAPTSRLTANLLYVSSHGWLGGFMRGNEMELSPAARPDSARARFVPPAPYFLVGRAAKDGRGFAGPQWIVLAQCSTLNSATWPLWARVLANSNPHVRGILAYEEASPAAGPAINIARTFFEALQRKVPFIDAWKQANGGVKWAAIVHKNARKDTLQNWSTFPALGSVALGTSKDDFNYYGYLSSAGPTPIFDVPPPFGLKLEWIVDAAGSAWEVLPENLDQAAISGNPKETQSYIVTLTAPPGQTIKSATLLWQHIRPNHPHQFKMKKLFEIAAAGSDWDDSIAPDGRTLHLKAKPGTLSNDVKIAFVTTDLTTSGLEAHHSYLWLSASMTTQTGTSHYDFKTKGLLFYRA